MKLKIFPIAGSGLELENVEFVIVDWDKKKVPLPPYGYRFSYVDELLTNEGLKEKVS